MTGLADDVMGRKKQRGPRGPQCRVREQPLDKRSLPGSAETGAGRLRALGIERGRPDRAVAPILTDLMAATSIAYNRRNKATSRS
ncbi:hypothetical protein CO665_34260 [Rhizobium anhuiense]|nr:hypothetical protein CO665_34260 [Rhizobium anhuiense]